MSCSVLLIGTAFVLLPMPETVKIIRAGIDDAISILELSRKTFIETYYEVSDKSTVLKYLDTHITLQKILLDLQNPSILFFIAKKGIQNIGFLKLFENKNPKGIAGKKCLMLDKLYVLQEFHLLNLCYSVDINRDRILFLLQLLREKLRHNPSCWWRNDE